LRGNKYSVDGECWDEMYGNYKLVKNIQHLKKWVKAEEAEIKDDRPHLETLSPNEKLFTIQDVFKEIGWDYSELDGGMENGKVKCCGQPVEVWDLLGCAISAKCTVCGKEIENKGFSADFDEVQCDDKRFWVIVNS